METGGPTAVLLIEGPKGRDFIYSDHSWRRLQRSERIVECANTLEAYLLLSS